MRRIAFVILFLLCCSWSYGQTSQQPDSARIHIPEKFDTAPSFKEGEKKFMEFIRENINYPLQHGEKNLSGLVVIRMTIDKDGSTSDFEVVKSLAERYDKEAIRFAALTDKMWIPAKLNGEDIAFSYLLPIRYAAPRGRKK